MNPMISYVSLCEVAKEIAPGMSNVTHHDDICLRYELRVGSFFYNPSVFPFLRVKPKESFSWLS